MRSPTSGESGGPSRRGFLIGSAASAAAVALTAAACSTDTPSAAATSGPVGNFELTSAGGKFGWSGLAVLGGGQSNKLFVIDAKYHKILTAITNIGPYNPRSDPSRYPNIRDCHAIVFTKDFKRMFTAVAFDYAKSVIIEYDPLTLREVARCPAGDGTHHIALSPDDKYLYGANEYGSTLTVINTAGMTYAGDIEVGTGPDYISPSMYWGGTVIDSPYLFVTVDGAKTVAVIDWKTNTVVNQIPMPATGHGINLTPDGKHVWLAGVGFQEVWEIEVATQKIVKKLPIQGSPIHISMSPDSKYVYITTSDASIFKVDASNYQTLWSAKGTTTPAHTGITPDGGELWTLNHGMDPARYPYLVGGQPVEGVQVWDTANGNLINEIPMEAMPHEIQFVPYATFGKPASNQDVNIGGNTVIPTTTTTTPTKIAG